MSSEIFLTLSEFAEDAQRRPLLLPFALLPRIIEKIRFRRLFFRACGPRNFMKNRTSPRGGGLSCVLGLHVFSMAYTGFSTLPCEACIVLERGGSRTYDRPPLPACPRARGAPHAPGTGREAYPTVRPFAAKPRCATKPRPPVKPSRTS